MNPESSPEIFVLLRHFYGVASTAAVMLACMDDAATAAEALGLHDVADTVRLAFVDDCLNSLDEVGKLTKLKKFMLERGFPIKGFALTGNKPDPSLSPEDHLMVGAWHW